MKIYSSSKALRFVSMCLLSLLFNSSFAQPSTVEVTNFSKGEIYPFVSATEKIYINRGHETMSVKASYLGITIQKFDQKKLEEISRKEYHELPAGFRLENVIEMNGKYFLFYEIWDKPNTTEQLFYYEIDFDKGELIIEQRKIISVERKVYRRGGDFFGGGKKFSFSKSFDDSKLLIWYQPKNEVKNDENNHDTIGLAVFNQELTNLWEQKIGFPHSEHKTIINDLSISSSGRVDILTLIYNDDSKINKTKEGKPNYHYELLSFDSSKELYNAEIIPDDLMLNNLNLIKDFNDKITCIGYYSFEHDLNDIKGVCTFTISPQNEIQNLKKHEIPEEILSLYVDKKQKIINDKKGYKGLPNLEIRQESLLKDGSVILTGEQFEVVSSTNYSSNGGVSNSNTYTYLFYDILVTKINPQGELEWTQRIPKRQTGISKYITLNGHDSFYIVFNDFSNNLQLDTNNVFNSKKTGETVVVVYKINKLTGNIDKFEFLHPKYVPFSSDETKNKLISNPEVKHIFLTESDEFMYEGYIRSKKNALIKMTPVK